MAAKRLSMRKIKEILRLSWEKQLGKRKVAKSVSTSRSSVSRCLARAEEAGLSWEVVQDLDEAELEAKLYPRADLTVGGQRAVVDWDYIHRELRRKGVTRHLLWMEYKTAHPKDGYQYSQFCEGYRRWRSKLDVVLRHDHRAGEKCFVDFSGDGIPIVDRETGEVTEAELFVAVLGASNYTFAVATDSQDLRCWIQCHIQAFEYFGGVTEIVVPDNTRDAVSKPCRYEPDLNPTYLEMADHYGMAVIPARSRKPRDKAKAENGVLIAQRWILAALRNHRFFSVAQANEAIAEKLEELNSRRFQKLDSTRRKLFEELDRPALRPLPSSRYAYADWSKPRASIDYHVEIDRHYYSVPYQLHGKKLDARYTATTVEVFHRGRRVASHTRSYRQGGHTTNPEHMPESHRRHLEWTPDRILRWAGKSGPATEEMVGKILAARRHPEQGFRSCLGLLRLGKRYGQDRLEAACRRSLALRAYSYKNVQSILKTGQDRQKDLPGTRAKATVPVQHDNVRGPDYYH